MKKHHAVLAYLLIFIPFVFFSCSNPKNTDYSSSISSPERIDGTTGTPLGGVGTGAVKYCAWTGILNAFTDMTPAGMQRYNHHVSLGASARFQFFSDRKGVKSVKDTLKVPMIDGRFSDDAIFPMHKAHYGSINDIEVRMTGFCPWNLSDFKSMCMPYAFFEFTLTNKERTPVEAAIALNLSYESNPLFIQGKGLTDESGMHHKAVYASNNGNAVITVGSDPGFFATGTCNNTITDSLSRVAVKISLSGNETKTIKFVLAWYKENTYGKYFYENFHTQAGTVADEGLGHFDEFRKNTESLVSGMQGSNLPYWITTYVTNILSNMVNNSVYAKDGRACMAEGEFPILGTIDEYWQGRSIIGSNLLPEFTWKELEYWGRTQFHEPYLGQIHHDFGANGHGVTDADLCAWDDHDHPDYRSVEDVTSWPDENVGFIVGAWETFIATDNQEKLKMLWPYLKNTGHRLLVQKDIYGDKKIPWIFETSHNMYDAGGYCQTYSTGAVIPAYKCMALMAEVMNDTETKLIFEEAESETYKGFAEKYLTSDYQYIDIHSEGALAGPWFSQCLRFDQYDKNKVNNHIFKMLEEHYKPLTDSLGYPGGTYDEWTAHLVGHFGGYALQADRPDITMALFKDMYNRSYIDRNRVFNIPTTMQSRPKPVYAATSIDGYYQYTCKPSAWRIYQDIIGYYRNRHTGEIWLEPTILPGMNNELVNGYFISAEGNGTVSCKERDQSYEISFRPENTTEIKGIYIRDLPGSPVITVNGIEQKWKRSGPEWKKRILVDWNGTADNSGLIISVKG